MVNLYMVLAVVASITVIVMFVYILQLRKILNQPPKSPPSEELSDFLRDFQSHGYSFVRVNPDNVFMRK